MTQPRSTSVALTRPSDANPGPLDERFYDLVEARFRRLLRDHPPFATFVGIHDADHLLGDGTLDAIHQEMADERAHLSAVEAIDPADLSETARFERDLEIHNLRRSIFDGEVHRVWERRSTAMDAVGDALFALFARDFEPLPERLAAIAGRLEATPKYLDENRTRAVKTPVRLWQQLEIHAAEEMPGLFDEISAAGEGVLDERELRRLKDASARAQEAVGELRGLAPRIAGSRDR